MLKAFAELQTSGLSTWFEENPVGSIATPASILRRLGTMNQKTVLITGCSSGIGLALATHIAKDEKKRFMGECDGPGCFITALVKIQTKTKQKIMIEELVMLVFVVGK